MSAWALDVLSHLRIPLKATPRVPESTSLPCDPDPWVFPPSDARFYRPPPPSKSQSVCKILPVTSFSRVRSFCAVTPGADLSIFGVVVAALMSMPTIDIRALMSAIDRRQIHRSIGAKSKSNRWIQGAKSKSNRWIQGAQIQIESMDSDRLFFQKELH